MTTVGRFLHFFIPIIFFTTNLSAQTFAVVSGNWTDAIWASSAGGAAGSASVPSSADSIVINSGVTVTVTGNTSVCSSIAFGDATGKISLDADAVLTVYGNFTLASTSHNAIGSWGTGAKIVFAGSSVQLMKGWSTTGFSTSFNYIQVNKNGGKVVTDGTNMRFGIGDTLEIVGGTFELASTDDIESRNAAGSATSFVLLVQPNGTFNMVGSTSHIRRASNTSLELKRIGKAIIYGVANLRSTSTNGLNFAGFDVEAGGQLVAASFSNSAVGNFNSGPVTVKPGGEFRVVSTAPFWEPTTASVLLQTGGMYRINGSDPTNAFPQAFINNGTVRYGSSSDQTIKDMNYHRLELSFGGIKTWKVDTNRVIADSLEVNNSADLRFTATEPKTVTVNGTIRLTSGIINNLDSGKVSIVLSDGTTISRATGVIAQAPVFEGGVNLRYTSSVQTVTPGAELPGDAAKLKKLTIAAPMGISLGSDITVNESLELTDGHLYLNNFNLIAGGSAGVSGSPSDTAMVVYNGSGVMKKLFSAPSSFTFAVGDTANGNRYTPAALNFTSGTFSDASVEIELIAAKHPQNISTTDFISRYWRVIPDGISSFSCDVAFTYHPSDVSGTESNIYLGRWNGSTWTTLMSQADVDAHRLTGTVTQFSEFTGGEKSAISSVPQAGAIPREFTLFQNFPNPFNPATVINYELPQTSIVTLKVYDLLGKEIAAIVNGQQDAGRYSVSLNAVQYNMASGLYFYKIEAQGQTKRFVQVHKMMLVK
jgi:hypothetical protein